MVAYDDPVASLGGSIIVWLWSLDHDYTAHPSCIVHREGLEILDEALYCGPVRYFYGPGHITSIGMYIVLLAQVH